MTAITRSSAPVLVSPSVPQAALESMVDAWAARTHAEGSYTPAAHAALAETLLAIAALAHTAPSFPRPVACVLLRRRAALVRRVLAAIAGGAP